MVDSSSGVITSRVMMNNTAAAAYAVVVAVTGESNPSVKIRPPFRPLLLFNAFLFLHFGAQKSNSLTL